MRYFLKVDKANAVGSVASWPLKNLKKQNNVGAAMPLANIFPAVAFYPVLLPLLLFLLEACMSKGDKKNTQAQKGQLFQLMYQEQNKKACELNPSINLGTTPVSIFNKMSQPIVINEGLSSIELEAQVDSSIPHVFFSLCFGTATKPNELCKASVDFDASSLKQSGGKVILPIKAIATGLNGKSLTDIRVGSKASYAGESFSGNFYIQRVNHHLSNQGTLNPELSLTGISYGDSIKFNQNLKLSAGDLVFVETGNRFKASSQGLGLQLSFNEKDSSMQTIKYGPQSLVFQIPASMVGSGTNINLKAVPTGGTVYEFSVKSITLASSGNSVVIFSDTALSSPSGTGIELLTRNKNTGLHYGIDNLNSQSVHSIPVSNASDFIKPTCNP